MAYKVTINRDAVALPNNTALVRFALMMSDGASGKAVPMAMASWLGSNERPELSILSEDFLTQIKASKHKNLSVELLKRLIKGNLRRVARRTDF